MTSSTDTQKVPLQALKALQFEWLARLSRMSDFACFVVDSDLTIVYCEPKLTEILEIPEDQNVVGNSVLNIIAMLAERGDFGPGDKSVFCELVREQIQTAPEDGTRRELTIMTPGGRRLQFRQDLDLDGYYLLRCKDITESYIKRHALKVALDSNMSGYIIYHVAEERYKMYGDAGRSVLGDITTQRLMNEGMKAIIHPKDRATLYKAWSTGMASKRSWTATFRIIDAQNQTRWIKSQATPQLSEAGQITAVILFYSDVSAQLRVQDDLRKATGRAEKALSAKNDFLGRLSHEVRTPMNAVVGIADALIHHNGDPKILPKLEIIQSSAEKIVRIVDESLQHTKLEESKLELNPASASPRQSVDAVCALWEQQALKNGIRLTCSVQEDVPEAMIFDAHRYEQCLNNLLSNAVKFSPNGRVDVVLTIMGESGSKRLVLAVKDTGIGMNEAQLESLFDAYTQADKSISGRFGGTGLGMNITKQIIELMGGSVVARSAPGEGTVIALTLPIQEERRIEDRRESTASLVSEMLQEAVPPKSDYESLRVLVVDDNTTNHMVVTSLLETLVDRIDVAENGAEAIAKLEISEYDLVLMDIHMPVMDGIEATLEIRGSHALYSDIPIIALTADPQYQQKRLCKNIGMDDALAKPIKLTELLAAFDRVAAVRAKKSIAA